MPMHAIMYCIKIISSYMYVYISVHKPLHVNSTESTTQDYEMWQKKGYIYLDV